MAKKAYSRMSEIPTGRAGGELSDACLVLEGGAFRGLYSQGFLDAMMLNGVGLGCVIGVSAGALSGVSYVSGQIGRSARINLGFRRDSRYVGVKALLHGRSILDIGFLTEDRGILEPLDEERFYGSEQRFVAVTTNCLTGETSYFEKGACDDIMLAVRASATMPFISPAVIIDGEPHLDGGCSCKIPYEWALGQGFEKILVIRTRELDFRKEAKEQPIALRVYGEYPAFARRLARSRIDYNRQCDEIERLHAEGRLLRFAPSEHVSVSRIEGDLEKLGDLYWLGCHDALENLEAMRSYLSC